MILDEKTNVEITESVKVETELITVEVDGLNEAKPTSFLLVLAGFLLVILNVIVRYHCGLYMIIADCDESYNYWEPLNLLLRGFGKQTWEYSPAWAIRSYAYLIPYYFAAGPFLDLKKLAAWALPPSATFYFLRVVALAGFTAFSELKLYLSLRKNFNQSTANWYLLFTTFAPGMSHASVALLPSSFAMTWINWGTASALKVLNTDISLGVVGPSVHAITCYLIAGLFGWPFALAIGVPFGLFTLRARYQTPPLTRIVFSCWAILPAMVIVLLCIDSYFYNREMLFVPLNIVLYNVFALEGEGPEIFGTEPFSYYILNLVLNFNVVFVLGYAGAVLNPYISRHKYKAAFGSSVPILVWSFIFFRQAHKEERFLYPIYSLMCVSAAVFTGELVDAFRQLVSSKAVSRFLILISSILYVSISGSRILALMHTYGAPLTSADVFHEWEQSYPSSDIQNVCVGREWYHFPTSMFLPDNYRLRFVRSGFDGLLPGDFKEGVSVKEAASVYPANMNAKNLFEADKVVPFEKCDFYIDNDSPVNAESGEPQLLKNGEVDPAWEVLSCEPIADPSRGGFNLRRVFYFPLFLDELVPQEEYLMKYCVFHRKVMV